MENRDLLADVCPNAADDDGDKGEEQRTVTERNVAWAIYRVDRCDRCDTSDGCVAVTRIVDIVYY